MRKLNSSGVPIFNDMERALLHADLMSRPCHVCGAKIGEACVVGEWNGKSTYINRSIKMKAGTCHMGRLPKKFNSEVAVDAALEKLNLERKCDSSKQSRHS